MKFEDFVWIVGSDIWTWFLTVFYIFLDLKIKNGHLHYKWKIQEILNIYNYIEKIEYNFKGFHKVIRTEFILISIYTSFSLLISFILYSLFPLITVLLSYVFSFILLFLWVNSNDKISLIEKIFILGCCFIYVIIEIIRILKSKMSIEETADSLIGGKSKRTTPLFYLLAFIFIIFLTFETVIIRIYNFTPKTFFSKVLFWFFILQEFYFNSYLIQSFYIILFSRAQIKNFRKFSYWEILTIMCTARVASFIKPFNHILAYISYFLKFKLEKYKHMSLFKTLSFNRLKMLYAVVYVKPYFYSSFHSRETIWKGDLKKKVLLIESKKGIFPIVIIASLLFNKYLENLFTFLRFFDVFLIILNYYLIFYESFLTFNIVSAFAPYYNIEEAHN